MSTPEALNHHRPVWRYVGIAREGGLGGHAPACYGRTPSNISYEVGALLVLALIVMAPLLQSVTFADNGASAASSFDSSSLAVGDYANYSWSNYSLSYLVGYSAGGIGANDALQFLNATWVTYDEMKFGWRIVAVSQETYVVDYSLSLAGIQGTGASLDFQRNVIVSRTNNSVYDLNGTLYGTWPYWLAPSYLSLQGNFTPVHGFPQGVTNLMGQPIIQFNTPDEFLSLPLGNAMPSEPLNSTDFLRSTMNITAQGTFDTDRLIVTYPWGLIVNTTELPGLSGLIGIGHTQPLWLGIYDRFSGIMLAYQFSTSWFTDDILLHSSFDVWQIGSANESLILTATNLPIKADVPVSSGAPGSSGAPASGYTTLLEAAVATVAAALLSAALFRRRRMKRAQGGPQGRSDQGPPALQRSKPSPNGA
jgi:hypothetical protein